MSDKPYSCQEVLPEKTKRAFSEEKAMTRAAGIVGIWTGLSRITGFVRDMITALVLGAGFGADAFFIAFRIPNLLRRLFAEGALSAAFIPTYVDTLERDGRNSAIELAGIMFTFVSILLAFVAVAGVLCSSWIVSIIAPGFTDDPAKFSLTVNLNRIMFPYIWFISLVALASGVLNSMGHFAAPAAAPVLLNLSMIGSVLFFAVFLKIEPFFGLAIGVVIAGFLQLGLQIPFLSKQGIRFRPDFNFSHPGLKRIGTLFVPAAFGGAVYQINVLVGTILASLLPSGGVSWLFYADRLVELPLGVFAIALGTAVLPSMSRQASSGDLAGLSRSVSFSLRLIAFFIIPASAALIVLSVPIIAVLFKRGLFTLNDAHQTAYALVWYTTGLWAFSGLKVVTQAFFSLKDTKTPLWISIGAVIVNLGSGILLMGPMAHGGLALATSLAAAFNFLTLFKILLGRLGAFDVKAFVFSIAKITVAALIMCFPLVYLRGVCNWELGLTTRNGLVLAGMVVVGLASFGISAYLMKCKELRSMIDLVKARLGAG